MAYRTPDNALRSFGALIVRKRLALGMSAQEMADKIGVSSSLLSRIESGEREPRLEIIRLMNSVVDIREDISNYLTFGKF